MKEKFLSVLLSILPLHGLRADIYALCMSPKPPDGFRDLVRESIVKREEIAGFSGWGQEVSCKLLEKDIETSVGATVHSLISSGQYLPLFKSLGVLDVYDKNLIESLKGIGLNENLHLLTVAAPLRLTQFQDFSWYNNRLRSLSLKGTDKDSFVDVEQLPQFSELNFFAASNIEIRNAIALDRVPKLRTVSLLDVTVDQVPTFAHLQPNGVKELKNIKLIKEARTPSVNKTK